MRKATTFAGGLLAATLLLSLAAPAVAAPVLAAPVTDDVVPDELAVVVVGDGEQPYANAAGPVSIQLVDSTGALGAAVAIPTEGEAPQHGFTIGIDRDQAGALQQSANHEYVTVGGYDAAAGVPDVNGNPAPDTLRVVARLDANGVVDTSTTLAGSFSERHVRGVASVDGTRYWAAGHGGDSVNPLRAGVLTVEHGGDTPTAIVTGSNQERNSRVPVIHDGQLYVSSDRDNYHGINQVGVGLPTASATQTLIAAAPAGMEVPHDFVFIGEHLYVAYTDGAMAIARYGLDGDAWVFEDSFAGEFWGLTGRQAGDEVVLYTTRGSDAENELVAIVDRPDDETVSFADSNSKVVAVAPPETAFRGVAFAPGFVPGDGPAVVELTPSVAWDVRVAGGTGNALSAVLGADTNPVATGTITDPGSEAAFDAAQYDVVVTSADQAIVADADIDFVLNSDGTFSLAADPSAAGRTSIAVTVTDTADERSTTSRLSYWVSSALPDATALAHVGLADASAAYEVGDGYFLVADDDSNQIRLFGPTFGEAVKEFDFTAEIGADHPTDDTFDLEGAARIDDTIYWVGSLGNTRSGNVRAHRDVVLATQVQGTGADTSLSFVGIANGLRAALVEWDQTDAHGLGADAFQFARATQPGYSAEGPNSLNLEGVTIAPDGTSLWLGFRSPLVPVGVNSDPASAGDDALIIAIDDIAGVARGAAVEVGEHFTLDLDGRAIRDLTETDDGNYLIAAGSADDTGNFAIFGWSGDPADAPVASATPLGLDGWGGSYESIIGASSLADNTVVRVLQDAGTLDIYGSGHEAQDLTREFMKFVSHDYVLDFEGAFAGGVDQPALVLGADSVRQGDSFEVTVSGFPAAAEVTFVLHSNPVTLGSATTNAAGSVTRTLTIPASVPAGSHTLTASTLSGTTISLPLTVLAGAGSGDSLSATGSSSDLVVGLGALAAVLVALGVALVNRARPARRAASR